MCEDHWLLYGEWMGAGCKDSDWVRGDGEVDAGDGCPVKDVFWRRS